MVLPGSKSGFSQVWFSDPAAKDPHRRHNHQVDGFLDGEEVVRKHRSAASA